MKDVNLLINNGVNIQKSLELFGDMETYNATLHDFLAEVEGKLVKIKQYKEISDMANYATLVHSLKSDAKYFGFDKLAELSYNHEIESKANNMYYVTDHFEELMEEANRIVNLVKQYLGIIPRTNSSTSTTETTMKEKKILVVDDSTIVRNFIQKIFSHEYEVLIANDGQEALDIIQTHQESIYAMLLDLNMPNVDGFQVLEHFKNNNLFAKIPVSIITGDSSKEAIDKAFKYPIVDMLQKPFNEVNIKSVVEKTISYRN
ncbi:MAG: response regulator [bacterium]|nr:response regulator [bacterium]